MGKEIDLMRLYPKGKSRVGLRPEITEEDRRISKQFGKDYFDGDRRHGYGGFSYNERFWTQTVKLFRDHYQLAPNASILDVGCAKGFMLVDFKKLMPDAALAGIDASAYAVEQAHPDVKSLVRPGNAQRLPFNNKAFDLVISINTLHNLSFDECLQGLREIQRVGCQAFIMVDGWHNEEQKRAMFHWVLTAETMMHADQWKEVFAEAGYTGDYFFWTVV